MTDSLRLTDLAREALDKCDWNQKAAAEWIVNLSKNDEQVRALLVSDDVLFGAAYRGISQVATNENAAVWEHVEVKRTGDDAFQGYARRLFDYRLSDGTLIADADKAQLSQESGYMLKTGRTYLAKARWFSLIAERLPDGARVKEVLNEEDLILMQQQAQPEE